MKQRDEEWLDRKITEDLIKLADAREKYLMEAEELQDIDMTPEKIEEIRQEAARRAHKRIHKRLRLRVAMVAAAILVLVVGTGLVSSGKKLFVPMIFEKNRGDGITTKIENTDSIYREYDEEEVCQEIEDNLGVLPVRFGYQPKGMKVAGYELSTEEKEVFVKYEWEGYRVHVYISKDYKESSINYQTDGEVLDTVSIESCGMEVPMNVIDDTQDGEYYTVSFEYLNTYYYVAGMLEKGEFIKIIENIGIKNV